MKMKAIVLPDYNANIIRAMRSLETLEKDIPTPKNNEVLIRVHAAPCNPSDIAFMRGGYNIQKQTPTVMGFECTGLVTGAGTDPGAQKLAGKRVSCFTQDDEDGTWAEYLTTDWENCIPVDESLLDEQAAALCINPFTAYALINMALEAGVKTIIQNAATGQVGEFIRNMAAEEGLQIINLVRKEEHLELLKSKGQKYVIDMSADSAGDELSVISRELNATMAFDAVGGPFSEMIFNAMPSNGQLVIYGGLADKPSGPFNTMDVIFENKKILGFNLADWIDELSQEEYLEIASNIQGMILDGLIETRIQGRFALDNVQPAMTQYIKNMSAGKILFTP